MSRYSSIFLFILACSAQARADVFLWSGNPDDVTITGINVEIAAAGTFKLEALTEPGGNVLADIGNVAIANGVTGTVIVFIERSTDNNNPGAVNVDSINLTNTSGVTGNLRELRITGDLGTAAASTVRNITGAMVVPGEISNDLTVTRDLAGNVTATSVSADIAISRNLVLNRTLDVGDMEGNITVNSRTFGEILASSLTGDITLADEVTPNGSITINSTYGGTIENTGGGVDGTITIGGDPNDDLTGAIILSGPGADDGLQGTIPSHSCERTAV